ncbi:MAG: hypothetical protein AB7V32_05175 [Candidatus Berkiella sp.]
MRYKILIIFTVLGLGYANLALAESNMFKEYSSDLGSYKEYRTSGYNVQPNRPGVWDRGCRTDNYYCTAQLERCKNYEGVEFKQPNIVRGHR